MSESGALVRAPRLADVAAGLLVVALVAIGTLQIEAEPAERAVDGLALVCGVVAAGSLVWWRRSTVFVAGVVVAAVALYLARRYPPGPALLPVPLAMLALGYSASRRVAWMGVVGLLAATAIGSALADETIVPHVLFAFGWAAAAVLAGQALAARGERAAAERARVARAHEQALGDERLRIARDVHDSVAHAMTTINVQAGVAAHLLGRRPEQAAVALEAIRTASRDVLEELGSILGVLRDSSSDVPLAPLAGLGDLSSLVEGARADGVSVTLEQSGDVDSIGPNVGSAAYRAVQEALTNSRRHAGAEAVVTVAVTVGERGSLHVTVRDDGGEEAPVKAALATSSSGFGLVGMRERIEASGGTLSVGPTRPSGFMIDAVWPDRINR
jgi:signal transduction histidine kinase